MRYCGEKTAPLTLPHDGAIPLITIEQLREWDVIAWGVSGLHPTRPNWVTRPGVNDAHALNVTGLQRMCREPEFRQLAQRRIVFLDGHARMTWEHARVANECPDRARAFHEMMPDAIRKACGVRHVASVWDASVGLTATPGTNWSAMTPDGVHHTMAINLMKARALLAQVAIIGKDDGGT